jgi:hypothetical protein
MGRLLEGKNAIIYGGGGGIGSGSADVAVVDALDEGAVDRHVGEVAARAGRIDVSFNLISRGDVPAGSCSAEPGKPDRRPEGVLQPWT